MAFNRKDQRGLFIGNDAGVTPAFGGGSLLGPILWTVGSDYLTADKPGFTTPDVKQSFAKICELFLSKSILLGALPTGGIPPPSPRASRHAMVRAVGNAGHPEGHH